MFRVVISCAVLLATFQATAQIEDGLCNFVTTSNPGLPKAQCAFPSCPFGGDCLMPTIDKASAKIEYYEPLIQWKDKCPNLQMASSCWEVYVDFKFRVAATDPSGVAYVGATILQEVDAFKDSKKFWVKADKRDPQGRYEIAAGVVVHVPPGKRLELSVQDLCARDTMNNEGCVLPALAQDQGRFSLGQ